MKDKKTIETLIEIQTQCIEGLLSLGCNADVELGRLRELDYQLKYLNKKGVEDESDNN